MSKRSCWSKPQQAHLHRLVQTLGEVARLVLDAHDNGLECVLEVTRHLVLDAAHEVVLGDNAVGLEGGLELRVAAHGDNVIELALVRAPLLLAGLVQLLRLLLRLGKVNFATFRLRIAGGIERGANG